MTEKKNGKRASLRTRDFEGSDPSNPSVAEQSIDLFTTREKAPPNDDSYFNFRSPPTDWAFAVKPFSPPHLFRHAVRLAEEELKSYRGDKKKVACLTEDTAIASPIQDAITSWLSGRPVFAITRADRRKSFYQWNAWDKETHRALISLAGECGVSAAVLFLVYSIKSMATSHVVSPHVEKLIKRVVVEWDRWLGQEKDDFGELLATFTH